MADFLTRLVERSYGAASPVQPLIASIYAPGPMAMAQVDDEQVTELEAPPDDNQTSSSRTVDASPSLALQAKAVSPSPPNRVVASRANSESIPVVARRVVTEQEAESRSADATPLQQSPGVPSPRRLAETPRRQESPAVGSDARTVAEAVSARPTSQPPIVLRPQLRTLIEQTEQQGNEIKEDRAAPTIRVTIGRIDVRAVFAPPPPAQRARPPAPALSLDDYLRSRDKEK